MPNENGPSEEDNRSEEPLDATGSNAGSGSWLDGLNEDNRKIAETHKWDNADALVKSYQNLHSEYGKSKPPGKDATDEQREAWAAQMRQWNNVPESADKYEFNLPEGVPDNMPYDQDFAGEFRDVAHKTGLSGSQAQALHDFYVAKYGNDFAAAEQQYEAQIEAADAEIAKTWGEPGSDAHNRKVELTNRAIRNLGGEELQSELVAVGVLAENGSVLRPKLATVLATIGEKLYAEDALHGGDAALEGNPFEFGSKHFDLMLQGKLVKANPDRARELITQAGSKPSDYQL